MIIDDLMDLQGEFKCSGTTLEGMIKSIFERSICYGFKMKESAMSLDNDKIRKSLRKYLIDNNFNRRYYWIIRNIDWASFYKKFINEE